ncbi:ORF1 [Anelloviridae sp.]|nr:ORF1 [Anelloviridae sp.]
MAWGWWRRRRRGWLRRWGWRRRRRPARRRARWAARRARRRRVRRRRFRRRGRPRRRTFKRRRRRRRFRRKPKIKLTQWQPDMVRRCFIRGFLAAVICGQGTFSNNYSSHLEDRIARGGFGGGHSTMRFSLKVFYEEHLRRLNYWTCSNKDLELVRYFYTTVTFYRHPTQDFIARYNRKTPLGGNILTAPSLHPGSMMTSKHRIMIPSLETRPKGKKTVKIRIAAPTLFTDKWYFSKDVCDLTLLNLDVTMADLRFPFCSPQTDNPCMTFQTLSAVYNNFLSITIFQGTSETQQIKAFLNAAMPNNESVRVLNTFKTEGNYSHPQIPKAAVQQSRPQNNEAEYFGQLDGLWGDPIYMPTGQTLTKLIEQIEKNMQNYNKKLKEEFPAMVGSAAHTHLTGIFGSSWLNSGRISPEVLGLYTEIIYNPYKDKGTGNHIWIDSLTKNNNHFKEGQSKCHLQDMPLWMMAFGYIDWIKKDLNQWDAPLNYRVMIISPYTFPMMYKQSDPTYGYVPVSYRFTSGLMPDGSSYIPFSFRGKWYPNLLNQQQVLEDLSRSGPFAPKTNVPSATLVMKYKSRFNFGGNPISEQVIRDPCTQPTYDIPGANTLPRAIQVIDPKVLGPGYSFRSFDIRRGYFSATSIKRVSEQSETTEFLFSGPKKPRIDLQKYEPPEDVYSTLQKETRPWESSQEEETEAPSEEEEERPLREQLQQQLREQHQLRKGIQHLFQQLVKTQQGVHINPCLQ